MMASGDYDQTNLKCRPKNPSDLIKKLVDLINHPISKHATERHLQILNEFLNASHYSFWLQDIPHIICLYESIVTRLETFPQFKKALECLLYFSAVPPMLTKLSDKIEYARDFQEYFSILGYLILCVQDNGLRRLVLDAIHGLLDPQPPIGYCCVPLDYCKEAVMKSRLPEILAQLVQVVSDDLYPLLLDIIFLTCQISTSTCQTMLQHNAIEYLLQRLEPTWQERYTKPKNPSPRGNIPTFDDTCCILWKLLNAIDGNKGVSKNPSIYALWSLQYAFRWVNICHGQRVNRNNLTALILKLLITFPTMEFTDSDLPEDISVIATTMIGCKCRSEQQFSHDKLDFQYKKLIWSCLHFFTEFQIHEENEIIKAVLKSLHKEHKQTKRLVEQHYTLAKIILRTIPKFVIHGSEVFLQQNGIVKIMRTIESYLVKICDPELLEAYIYCLNEIMLLDIEPIISSIAENKGVDIIIAICDKILENDTLSTLYQKILARGFCILQILFKAGNLTNYKVVDLTISYLNRVIHPNENDPLFDVRLTICAIHLLWECLLTPKQCYRKFLKLSGIYVVLDITEMSTFPIKSLSLGLLADTLQKPACVPYLITWRKHGKKIISLLLEIFRNKTEKECDQKENTELSDKKTDNVWLSLCNPQKITFQSNCISKTELLKNCRYKIHAILQALKIKYKEIVEIANEHYKLYNEKLKIDDELTMLFAENYFSLKLCEAWTNVSKELQKAKVIPVDSDNDELTERIYNIRQWKLYLQHKLNHIISKEAQWCQLRELETYAVLKDARLSDALDALKDLQFISNCTERMFQMRQKLLLQHEVDGARVKNYNFHRTICDLPFTNIYNQRINIQSNIIYEKREERCPISPVSSDDSESLESNNSEHDLTEYQLEC